MLWAMLGGDGECVRCRGRGSRGCGSWPVLARRWSSSGVEGGCSLEGGGEGAGGGGGSGTDEHEVAAMVAGVVEEDADGGWGGGDDEGLGLGPCVASGVAEQEADGVGAVLHVGGGEEAGLPEAVGVVCG